MNSKQKHLDGISIDQFKNWKQHHAFISYASSAGEFGWIELGIDGNGFYAVKEKCKTGSTTTFYKKPEDAKKAYKSLLK